MSEQTVPTELTMNEAMILQQIHEDGIEDLENLTHQLGMPSGRLQAALRTMKRKGLLVINHDYRGTWISLSGRGNRLMSQIWPEAQLGVA